MSADRDVEFFQELLAWGRSERRRIQELIADIEKHFEADAFQANRTGRLRGGPAWATEWRAYTESHLSATAALRKALETIDAREAQVSRWIDERTGS